MKRSSFTARDLDAAAVSGAAARALAAVPAGIADRKT